MSRLIRGFWLGGLLLAGLLAPGRAELTLPGRVVATASVAECPEGGSVAVTLSVTDHRKRGVLSSGLGNVVFRIVSPPEQGRLGPVQSRGGGSDSAEATVEYVHTGGAAGDDGFRFVVTPARDPRRVLASGSAAIRILRPQLQLAPADGLTFPPTRVGDASRKTVSVRNAGYGLGTVRLAVSPPFQLEDSPVVRVPRGQEATVRVVFRPDTAGTVTGRVTAADLGGIPLVGQALMAVTADTTLVDLGEGPVGERLERWVTLRNASADPVLVQLETGSPFSVVQDQVLVPGRGTARFGVRAAPTRADRATGQLRVKGGGGTVSVPLVVTGVEPPAPAPPEPVVPPEPPAPVAPVSSVTQAAPVAVVTSVPPDVVESTPPTPPPARSEPVAEVAGVEKESVPTAVPSTNAAAASALPRRQTGPVLETPARRVAGPNAPTDLRVDSVTSRSAILSWRADPRRVQTNVTFYFRRFVPAPGGGAEFAWEPRLPARVEVNGDRCVAELHGLRPGVTTVVEVRGVSVADVEDETGVSLRVRTPPEAELTADARPWWPLALGGVALAVAAWGMHRWWTRPFD
jgi:hypothetical protein